MDKKSFGAYIKKLRKDKDLTLKELGEVMGYSDSYISLLENGKKEFPSTMFLIKLTKALDVSYSDLFKKAGIASDEDKDLVIDEEYMKRIESWREKKSVQDDFDTNPIYIGSDLEEVLKEAPQVYYGSRLLTRDEQKKITTMIELILDGSDQKEREKTLKLITTILE